VVVTDGSGQALVAKRDAADRKRRIDAFAGAISVAVTRHTHRLSGRDVNLRHSCPPRLFIGIDCTCDRGQKNK